MLVWGGVSLGVLNLTITLFNKLGDSKNAKTVFLEEIHAYKKNKMLEVVSAASTAFDV
jgi:phage terminase large subunit-like protein